jgi:hypothetical protein
MRDGIRNTGYFKRMPNQRLDFLIVNFRFDMRLDDNLMRDW